MRAYDYMPGVPAAGHIRGGFWHPGRADGCPKCEPPQRRWPTTEEIGRMNIYELSALANRLGMRRWISRRPLEEIRQTLDAKVKVTKVKERR